MLVSSIVVHGRVPHSMNESVIVKNKRVNDKRNYRPICLSNICSKIIEVVFIESALSCKVVLLSLGLPKHGTELCVFAFKELLRFYKKHGSPMHVAFLDASKVFDRVNRRKLLLKLLSNSLDSRYTCVRWGSTHSDFSQLGME